ncbi:MAG: methylglyoxal synthase [Pseudomonadota bacterium]
MTPSKIDGLGIAMVAHDRMKPALADWASGYAEMLARHRLFATGTTGGLLSDTMPDLSITAFESGPLGGDLQIGAKVVDGEIDVLIFFVDPLTPQPHDVDVKALIRIATLYGTPLACNAASADALMSTPWMRGLTGFVRQPSPFLERYRNRTIPQGDAA